MLAIRCEVLSKIPLAGKVSLVNEGDSELRVWRMGNSWGDRTLGFELRTGGQTQGITPKPQIYTRNFPATVVLAPGGSYDIPFNLSDGTWQSESAIGSPVPGTEITAVYNVGSSPEAAERKVWIGNLRSQAVPLE